jgi:hypothetical protein
MRELCRQVRLQLFVPLSSFFAPSQMIPEVQVVVPTRAVKRYQVEMMGYGLLCPLHEAMITIE